VINFFKKRIILETSVNLKKNKLFFIFYKFVFKYADIKIFKILNFAEIKANDFIIKKTVSLHTKKKNEEKISLNKNPIRIINKAVGKKETKIEKYIIKEFKNLRMVFLDIIFDLIHVSISISAK